MAMKDGMSLAEMLGQSDASRIEDVLKEYEAEMGSRTTESVLGSRANSFST